MKITFFVFLSIYSRCDVTASWEVCLDFYKSFLQKIQTHVLNNPTLWYVTNIKNNYYAYIANLLLDIAIYSSLILLALSNENIVWIEWILLDDICSPYQKCVPAWDARLFDSLTDVKVLHEAT